MAASTLPPGNNAASLPALASDFSAQFASINGASTSDARVSSYRGYQSSHRETCRVCISRHLAHCDDIHADRIVKIREAIEEDEIDELTSHLKRGYPACMLLEYLFLAVKSDAWECLDVLLMEQDSNVWIQFSNDEGHNILQEILCKPELDLGAIKACILSILERLQSSMDDVRLKSYVNKLWAPGLGNQIDVGSILHEKRVSLLHVAVFEAQLDIAEELLKCGANPNQLCSNDHSPLMLAARNADFDMIDRLVSHGANFVQQNAQPNTKYWDTSLTILVNRCSQNGRYVPSGRGKMCIMAILETATLHLHEFKALVPHLDMEMMSVLINNWFPSNVSFLNVEKAQFTSDDHLRTEFMQSALIAIAFHARSGALEIFCHLSTSLGVDINRPALAYESFFVETETNIHMCTALQAACQAGRSDSVDCLLSFGADPDCTGINGGLPITHVLEYKRPGAINCVTSLLRYGCSVNMVALPDECQSSRDLPPVDFYLL